MNLDALLSDVERKPEDLLHLGRSLQSAASPDALLRGVKEVMLFGMGSSRYAAEFGARQLRARGIRAWSDYSSAAREYEPDDDTLVVVISASGATPETVQAAQHHAKNCRTIALTNQAESAVTEHVDQTQLLLAGEEVSGVVTRSMIHTIVVLEHLTERLLGVAPRSPQAAFVAAEAISSLLDTRAEWLDQAAATLDSADGVYFLAPASRGASAQQSALLVREIPRRPSTACEVSDWSHVDVYLTKTLDYRAVIFGHSEANAEALQWLGQRGAKVLGVGMNAPEVQTSVRYSCDDDLLVAALVDTVVAELVTHHWASGASRGVRRR
jgi:fructoselysine-6-P-deglycase FrlB-like protein